MQPPQPSEPSPATSLRWAVVEGVLARRRGASELAVRPEGGSGGEPIVAVAYLALVGDPIEGDRVLVNTSAIDLGLGTGGLAPVVAAEPLRPLEGLLGGGDRSVKARYTPLQAVVATLEERYAGSLDVPDPLRGVAVVCAPLHSMIAPIAAGARAAGARRVVYVMTDGAALPGPLSRLVPELLRAELVDDWITCGQAFGGGHEAVTIWSALAAARVVLGADVIVVADGPGNLGTSTRWGVSALGSATALDAVRVLDGQAIAAVRMSGLDTRPRHRPVSHHSITILRDLVAHDCNVAVPALEPPLRTEVWDALRSARLEDRHQLVEADGRPALDLLRERDVEVSSMGRPIEDDRLFALSAAAAGVLGGRAAAAGARWRPPSR